MTESPPTGRPAFEAYVRAGSARLVRTAYLLTQDHALAEDLVQTALAKAWLAWRRVEGDPEPYVRKVLVNTYFSWWRRRWNGETPTGELPDQPGATDPQQGYDERDAVWRALGRLPKKQRAAVVLRYYDDLPEAEAARILGCSVGTVKSQTAKALAKLRIDPSLRPEGGR